jgi:NAD-dependent deacetylase
MGLFGTVIMLAHPASVDPVDPLDSSELHQIVSWLQDASFVVVLTGAGISTESGIPDFRGPQGTWTKNPDAEKAAHIDYYLNDPEVRRRAWQNRLTSEMWRAEPNAAHRALVDLERKGALQLLVTQNVDGLHAVAGTSRDRLIEVHGSVHEAKCMDCDWHGPMEATLERVRAGDVDPACTECGGILKSATISFGENLVARDLHRAQVAASRADVFLALGTSLGVYPAAALPELALRAGARLIIVNEQETPFDPVADVVWNARLGEVLPEIAARV